MAIPDTYTYSMQCVCKELQFTGSTLSASPKLSNLFIDAPNASYDSTYKGTETCLRNFRKYALMTTITCTTPAAQLEDVEYDDVNGYMWGVFGANTKCVVRIARDGTVSGFTVATCGGEAIAFDGTYMWYPSGAYKTISRINVTTGVASTYSGFVCCPIAIAYDYVNGNMWTANNDISGAGNQYAKISSSGTITQYTCTSLCRVNGITFDGTNVWISSSCNHLVGKITPSTGAVTTYSVGQCPGVMTFDGTYVWSINRGNNSISKITTGGTVTTYTSGIPSATDQERHIIGVGSLGAWFTNGSCRTISKISQSGEVRTYARDCNCYSYQGMAYDCDCSCLWTINIGSCISVTKIGIV